MAGIPQINIIKIPPSLTGFDVVWLSYHGSRIANLPVGLSYHGSRCSQRLQSGCHSRNAPRASESPRASANGFAVLRGHAVCGCHNVTALKHPLRHPCRTCRRVRPQLPARGILQQTLESESTARTETSGAQNFIIDEGNILSTMTYSPSIWENVNSHLYLE